jgi:hypothetical protein
MTNSEIELIKEFLLVNGQRIEGSSDKRQLYNMYEKQIKCDNCIVISIMELKRSRRVSLLVKRLSLIEFKQLIITSVHDLWDSRDIRIEVIP